MIQAWLVIKLLGKTNFTLITKDWSTYKIAGLILQYQSRFFFGDLISAVSYLLDLLGCASFVSVLDLIG
jgi:hypothetical protein